MPDFAGALVGWRLWLPSVTTDGVRLRSLMFPAYWRPGQPFRAACLCPRRRPLLRPWRRAREHAPVQLDSTCGVYAVDRIEHAMVYADHLPIARTLRGCIVVGSVALWGRVVVGEHGWRAELAYPTHLYVGWSKRTPASLAEQLLADLRAYRVPVEALDARSVPEMVEQLRSVSASE